MFKTLITTCLLTFSCCGGALHVNHQEEEVHEVRLLEPKNVYSAYDNALYGAYCVREDLDWSTLSSLPQFNHQFVLDNTNTISIYYYESASNFYIDTVTGSMTFGKLDVLSTSFLCNVTFRYDLESDLRTFTYINGQTFSGLSATHKRAYIYFKYPYYIDSQYLNAWNCIFTKEGNSVCPVYDGWYTFNNSLVFGDMALDVRYLGNITVDNNLYDTLSIYNASQISASYYNNQVNTFYRLDVYKDGAFQITNKNIYFTNVMMPVTYYDYLSQLGTFSYVYQPVQYTFGDMIFSVVDAPIYMLSQLFSFDLFGIQFYVAFMGIVTIVLICFVLKKII